MISGVSKLVAPAELVALTASAGPTRYKHLVGQVVAWQAVWGLRSPEGWVSAAGEAGATAFPVWPHQPYASQCISAQWDGSVATSIEVHEFLEVFVPSFITQGTQIAAFPTPSGATVLVSAAQFAEDLRAELERIE